METKESIASDQPPTSYILSSYRSALCAASRGSALCTAIVWPSHGCDVTTSRFRRPGPMNRLAHYMPFPPFEYRKNRSKMMPVSHQLSARLPGRGYATPMQRPGRPARRLAAPPKAFDLSAIDLSAIQTSFAEAAAYKAPPSEEATASVGIALGLLGLSFVGTFLVLPRFSSLFKDEIQWNDIYPELVEGGAEEVDAAEAAAMTKRGAIIVDVRLEQKRQNYAIEKSVSAPLYRPITGMGLVSNLRRFGFGFFGVYGTERNPDFLAELEKNAEKDQQVILVCEMGGSLEQKPGATTGFQSRSLKAMHIARKAGFKKLYYLKNGVSAWARMESPEGVETEKLQGVSS